MKTLLKQFEDLMVAVTFAEAGEYEEANRRLGAAVESGREERESIGKAGSSMA